MHYLIQEPTPEGALVKPLDVESAISGRVVDLQVSQGRFVVAGDPLLTVNDWSTLWLRVPLFPVDAGRVDPALPAVYRDEASGLSRSPMPITFPTATRPATRTIDQYYKIENQDWLLRVGQSILVELPVGANRNAKMIPRSAVLYNTFGQPSCFVTTADKTAFIRRRIELGVRQDNLIEVTRGLDEDEFVVSVGAEQLSAEESKADLAVENDD